MGREFELKYRADGEKIAAIRDKFGNFVPISMETTYYDTPDGALGRLHWTLRRRLENGASVCTLKTPAEGGARGEWEVNCGDIREAVAQLRKLGAPEALPAVVSCGLIQVCAARFTRLAALVSADGCTVEIALDQGVLSGGGRELPFVEVEVELKVGSQEAAVAFARALAEEFGLVPQPASKFQRALALAKENQNQERKNGQSGKAV